MKAGIERCESPIEVALAQAFARTKGFSWRDETSHPWEIGHWEGGLYLLAQPVYGERYRCDFGINPLPLPGNDLPAFLMIVEADGHAFHERTKAQARRDRQRDRYMVSTGATLLRFTGSEIHADADACAAEAYGLASRMWTEVLTDAWEAYVRATHPNGECAHDLP